jgi:hypothetical protein
LFYAKLETVLGFKSQSIRGMPSLFCNYSPTTFQHKKLPKSPSAMLKNVAHTHKHNQTNPKQQSKPKNQPKTQPPEVVRARKSRTTTTKERSIPSRPKDPLTRILQTPRAIN